MGTPLDGIPTVLAVAAAAIAAGGLAVAIARILRLDRWLTGGAPAAPVNPEAMIDRLADFADAAKSEGLLGAEGRVDPRREPLLAEGLSMVVDGRATDEITACLDDALDARVGARSLWARILGCIPCWPSLLNATAAAVLAIAMIGHAVSADQAPTGWVGGAGLAFLVAAVIGAVLPVRAAGGASRASALLWGMLQIAAVGLIRAGHDGNAVRTALALMLPASGREAPEQAEAA